MSTIILAFQFLGKDLMKALFNYSDVVMSFGFFVKVLLVTKLRNKALRTEFEFIVLQLNLKNEIFHKNKAFIKLSHHPLGPNFRCYGDSLLKTQIVSEEYHLFKKVLREKKAGKGFLCLTL